MATIEISKEDLDFLKDLQHELLTQPNDGQADPKYWAVEETVEEYVPEGCGEEYRISYDGDAYTVEEFIEKITESIDSTEDADDWDEVDKNDPNDIVDYVNDHWNWGARAGEISYVSRISKYTGAFLTKRACKEYIERFGYNHTHPRTYAMTAIRNFEYERLLKILKTMKFPTPDPDNEILRLADTWVERNYPDATPTQKEEYGSIYICGMTRGSELTKEQTKNDKTKI